MSYKINWEENGVLVNFYNSLSAEDVLKVNMVLYGDSHFDNLKYQISDFTQAEFSNAEPIDVRKIAALDASAARWNNEIKIVLINVDERIQKFIEMYEDLMKSTKWVIRTFSNIDQAREWLNSY